MNTPSVEAGFHGMLAGHPISAAVWNEAGTLCWSGQLRIENKTLHELLRVGDTEPLDPVLSAFLKEFIGPISETLEVKHSRKFLEISLSLNELTFRVLRSGHDSAFVLKIDQSQKIDQSRTLPHAGSPKLAPLRAALVHARETLGPRELFLAYRRGGFSINEISKGLVTTALPQPVVNADWLLVGKYSFGDSAADNAIKKIFGGSGDLEIIAGYDKEQFNICLAIPALQTKYVTIAGLYVLMTVGHGVLRFEFRGDFQFRLPDGNELTLTAASSFTATSFLLSAEVNFKQSFKLPLLDVVSLDNVALLIGSISGGVTFGFLATLHIRKLSLFGAIILNVEGNVPVPILVSGAISPLSIYQLYKDLTDGELQGLEALDIIKLEGLDFPFQQPFDVSLFEKGDTHGIATFFNNHVDPTLAVDPGDIQIRQQNGGYALLDRPRMRHYFIDAFGAISLRAQFYYAMPPRSITLGSFPVTSGLFLAGTIKVFDTPFKLLFSIRENEGILAFARIAAIDVGGVLHISRSSEEKTSNPIELELHSNDPLRALVPLDETGLVFYLSASKREVTFYFDGRVKLLGIFEAETRVNYAANRVSIDVATKVFGVKAKVVVDASYADFLSAKLRVSMTLDSQELLNGLGGVTKAINKAILALTKAVNDAQESLNAAQERVNALYGEIKALTVRIKKCREVINSPSAVTNHLVKIAKGLEIATYQVAKTAVSTAIRSAKAILTLAQEAVGVFGALGKDVLDFVNAAIKSASSLLLIRHLNIVADIAAVHQAFEVDIAFVALGKAYSKRYPVEGDVLRNRLLPFVQEKFLQLMKPDLDNLENGRAQERALAFSLEATSETEPIPKIERAKATIDNASKLFNRMFELYRENFGEDLSRFDALQTSLLAALDVADHALETAKKAMPARDVRRLIAAMKKERHEISRAQNDALDDALAEVNAVDKLQDHVDAASSAVADARKLVESPRESKYTRGAGVRAFATPAAPMSEVAFLEQLQADVLETFADQTDDGYIDLTQETSLDDSFDAAMVALGSTPAPKRESRAISFSTRRQYIKRL